MATRPVDVPLPGLKVCPVCKYAQCQCLKMFCICVDETKTRPRDTWSNVRVCKYCMKIVYDKENA